jgi:hypothetical protein
MSRTVLNITSIHLANVGLIAISMAACGGSTRIDDAYNGGPLRTNDIANPTVDVPPLHMAGFPPRFPVQMASRSPVVSRRMLHSAVLCGSRPPTPTGVSAAKPPCWQQLPSEASVLSLMLVGHGIGSGFEWYERREWQDW